MERDPEYAKRIIAKTPLARAAEVSEIANGILWLLSDEASYITGAILDISGGMVTP
jgi:NAD(P)-dependent dehydrogenase (short-subunit alcohol dehydrogenase family)